MAKAPMNPTELFFRSLLKSMDNLDIMRNGNEKMLSIPVQYNSQGQLTVLNLVFKSVLDIEKGEFLMHETVEVFDTIQRKEEEKVVVEMNSFLYYMRFNDEYFEAMEELKKQMHKLLSFGKRELNTLRKEAGLSKEIVEEV